MRERGKKMDDDNGWWCVEVRLQQGGDPDIDASNVERAWKVVSCWFGHARRTRWGASVVDTVAEQAYVVVASSAVDSAHEGGRLRCG